MLRGIILIQEFMIQQIFILNCYTLFPSTKLKTCFLKRGQKSPVLHLPHTEVCKPWIKLRMNKKTLESPLDCKEIQPGHPKGNQPWILTGRTEAEAPTMATWCEELTPWKRPWCWERLRARGEGDDRGWDGWRASPTQWLWVWASSRRQWRTEAWHAAAHGVAKS